MSRSFRIGLFLAGAGVLGYVLMVGLSGLPSFGTFTGEYGLYLNELAPIQRETLNVVTAVVYDYRALDSLGEEMILFAAVVGIALVLRSERAEREESPEEELPGRESGEVSEAVQLAGMLFLGLTTVLGIYLVTQPHLTPGGGFQGGAVIGSALLLVYLAGDFERFELVGNERILHALEAAGLLGFLAFGIAGMIWGEAFLMNVLPLGSAGRLLSAGTIPLLSITVGVAVACGLVLLVREFIQQAVLVREGRQIRPKT